MDKGGLRSRQLANMIITDSTRKDLHRLSMRFSLPLVRVVDTQAEEIRKIISMADNSEK